MPHSFLIAIILPALACASPILKSFCTLQNECASYLRLSNDVVQRYANSGYPDEPNSRKLIHCILLNARAWDDNCTSGVKDNVLRFFFEPAGYDSSYVSRTQDCLSSSLQSLPQDAFSQRAYQSFLCYYRYYGNIASKDVYIPFTAAEHLYNAKLALLVEETPRCVLDEISRGIFSNTTIVQSVQYNLGLIGGLYDPQTGSQFDRLYEDYAKPELLSAELRQCEAAIWSQCYPEPLKHRLLFDQCHGKYTLALAVLQQAAQEILASSAGCCNRCGSVAPCSVCNPASVITGIYPTQS